ncbi:MAG: hypothetical protein O7E52_17780 [Candidatus Poribacteria bacterium]|nr:hypothetical protein [Candidatus Poribacteria bacterium]
MLQQAFKELLQFLSTTTGFWTLLGIGTVIALGAIYHQKRQIPGLTAEFLPEETWFINRDDNHRLAIIVSLRLINKSGGPVRIQNCKLSGYSPKDAPPELILDGYDKTIELEYPKHDLFRPGEEYIVNPYTEQQMWVFYESSAVTMTNILHTPIILKDANRKRKSVHVTIPRNMQQITLYREAAMR